MTGPLRKYAARMIRVRNHPERYWERTALFHRVCMALFHAL